MAHKLIRFINVELMSRGNLRCGTTWESTRICILATRQSLHLLGCNMSPIWKLYSLSVTLSTMHQLLLQISWVSDTSVTLMLNISCPDYHLDTFFQKVVLHYVCLSFNCDYIALGSYSLKYNHPVNPTRGIWQKDSISCPVCFPLGCWLCLVHKMELLYELSVHSLLWLQRDSVVIRWNATLNGHLTVPSVVCSYFSSL